MSQGPLEVGEQMSVGEHRRLDRSRAGGPHSGATLWRETELSLTGMRLDPVMGFDAWTELGAKLGGYCNASCWWLGDWLAFGQARYGRRYRDAIAVTDLEYQTLRNYAVVARRFDLSRRRDNLSFQHHAEVCALCDQDQEFWLDLAADHHWSKAELRRRRRGRVSDGPSDAGGSAIRMLLEPGREQQWREAAQRSECALEQWIVQALDDAAAAVLDRAVRE